MDFYRLLSTSKTINKTLTDNFIVEYLRYAHGIVSEYLAEDLSKKLAEHLNIPEEIESKKRKPTSPNNGSDEKRIKKDFVEESPKLKIKKINSEKVCFINKNVYKK